MNEKITNIQVIEKIAKEILQAKSQEEIDGFVSLVIYVGLFV
ncbi:hypothetical protein [Desulfosporosinus shakirovi]|nr:hypothetical protein [Desulfosporosinus sp. SRJS8]